MEDDEPKRASAHEVGMPLDLMSVEELEDRVGLLEREIQRLRSAIVQKRQSRATADAFFKL